MRILALDYGSASTGVAVCDPSGTIVRPLEVVKQAASDSGYQKIKAIVARENVKLVLIGMPVTLAGERGSQASETEDFVAGLRPVLDVPVETWDERFTTKIAVDKGRYSGSDSHSIAACCLLEDYLGSKYYQQHYGGDRDSGREDA